MLAACNGACMIEQTSCYHTTHELVYGDDGSDEEKDSGGSEPGKRRSEGREEAIDGQNGTGSGER